MRKFRKAEALKKAVKRRPDCILQPFDQLINKVGFDAVCAFSDTFSGTSVYIPQLTKIFGRCLEQYVIDEWNGGNMLDLAQKTGFSEKHIRNLLKRHMAANRLNRPKTQAEASAVPQAMAL